MLLGKKRTSFEWNSYFLWFSFRISVGNFLLITDNKYGYNYPHVKICNPWSNDRNGKWSSSVAWLEWTQMLTSQVISLQASKRPTVSLLFIYFFPNFFLHLAQKAVGEARLEGGLQLARVKGTKSILLVPVAPLFPRYRSLVTELPAAQGQEQEAAHAVSWVRVLPLGLGAALRAAPAGAKGLLYYLDFTGIY